MELWQVLTWGIATVLLIVIEILTVQMVCVWFAAGALAAFIISLFGGSLVWQLASFVIVSILLLILTRPIIKKSTHKEISHTNADSIIGEKGIVYE
ncbi:MAG: NfeD family protein, partial [Oscillospiraceae bacterium]